MGLNADAQAQVALIEALADACRAKGIRSARVGEVEIAMGDAPRAAEPRTTAAEQSTLDERAIAAAKKKQADEDEMWTYAAVEGLPPGAFQ